MIIGVTIILSLDIAVPAFARFYKSFSFPLALNFLVLYALSFDLVSCFRLSLFVALCHLPGERQCIAAHELHGWAASSLASGYWAVPARSGRSLKEMRKGREIPRSSFGKTNVSKIGDVGNSFSDAPHHRYGSVGN